MPPKDKYTDPELRDQVKEEIQNSDKGGAPGQWSARKAQFMAQEYKKRGGGYTTDQDQKDESQKQLDNWTEEEWQTKDGSGHAKQSDGTEKRYLPKKAWEKMTEEEKEETDQKKQEESREGKQFVENTDKAKQSRKKASKSEGDDEQDSDVEDEGDEKDGTDKTKKKQKSNGAANGTRSSHKRSQGKAQQNGQQKGDADDGDDDDDAAAKDEDGEDEYVDDGEADADKDGDEDVAADDVENDEDDVEEDDDDNNDDEEEDAQPGHKRKADANKQANGTSKKQKDSSGNGKPTGTVGSKHMDAAEPAPRGSKDKLPKKGQKVSWKALPGYVEGEVVNVITKDQDVDGKAQKASDENPKVVLKSDMSGKICVHKPDSCFYYI